VEPEGQPGAPLYRPEVGAYLANQYAANSMFVHSLHDRLGEPQWFQTQGSELRDSRPSAWLRLVRKEGESTSRDGNFDADTDSSLIQAGGDIAHWSIGNEQGWVNVGGMLGYGSARADTSAAGNPARSRGDTDGWSVGAYGTWYQNDADGLGWYVDVWATYDWFENTVQGDTLPEVRYDSRSVTLSGETGFALRLGHSSKWTIEPQVQWIHIDYSEDNTIEVNGTRIDGNDGSGWISRLGVCTYRTWKSSAVNRQIQPNLTLNWWHDSIADALAFNDVALRGLYPKNRYEAKLGIKAKFDKGWSAWGNFGYQWGSQDYRETGFELGAKYSW
jgi:outer membrane autotransporter protein